MRDERGVIIWRDVTEEVQHARERARMLVEQRAAQERQTLLERASLALAHSLDADAVPQRLADLFVPTLGDGCSVVLLHAGVPTRVASAHMQPAKAELQREIDSLYPTRVSDLAHQALRMGEPVVAQQVDDAQLQALAQDAHHLQLLKDLHLQSLVVVPLRADGEMMGVLTLMVTESDRQYSAADASAAGLVASRAVLALRNARLHSELQAALAAREALLASVAHDLRSPLGSILLAVQSARIALGPDRPTQTGPAAEISEALNIADGLARRMDGLIQELLDAAQLQQGGQLTLYRVRVNLVGLVRQALESRAEQGHRLIFETSIRRLPVSVDELRLSRVLDNLLSNALKYSSARAEVVVTLRRERTEAGQWAVLTVQDHGIGIPAQDLPHVFEPFHRARNTQGSAVGTGLGLWGSRHIVEEHAGSIQVESQEEVGTTVTVCLPTKACGRLNATPPRMPATAVLSSGRES